MKVWMRLLRPNGALEAKRGYGGRDEAVKAKLEAKRGHGGQDEAVEAKRGIGGLNKAIEVG
jgi:hypothetical protein